MKLLNFSLKLNVSVMYIKHIFYFSSNDPEKRFVGLLAAKAASFALGKAVTAYCNKGGCKCICTVLNIVK